MPRIRTRRASALVLAFVFVTGSLGLANIDAWAFHRPGVELGTAGPHYEPVGTTCGHADRCVLGATILGPRLLTPPSLVGRLGRIARTPRVRSRPAERPAVSPGPFPQPRAPPALLA